jgi:hypothetical protein
MQPQRYHARVLLEIGAELERLDERVTLLNRDLTEDDFDGSVDARDELAATRTALMHAHTSIERARGWGF